MKIQKAVKRYTAFIAGGVLLLTAVMLAVFAAMGKLDATVLLGAAWGACFSVLNFFLMGLAVQSATEMPVEPVAEDPDAAEEGKDPPLDEDAKRIKARIQLSYTLRMAMMVVAALVALIAPCFHTVAAVLPMLFPRIVILFQGFLNKKEV